MVVCHRGAQNEMRFREKIDKTSLYYECFGRIEMKCLASSAL